MIAAEASATDRCQAISSYHDNLPMIYEIDKILFENNLVIGN